MNSENTLYVGNLNPGLEDVRLFQHFKPFGDLVSCKIMRDIYSGESRRFAFISYSTKEAAEKAMKEMNYKKIDGWELRICFKKTTSEFKPEANIFVKNLPDEVNAKELDELCSKYGNILSCTIRNDD